MLSGQVFNYDGLVVVHPDCDKPINPNYLRNLKSILKEYKKLGKRIFVVDDVKIKDRKIYRLVYGSGAISLPLMYSIEDHQNCVYSMAGLVGKSPREISLAFGGIMAVACVLAFARAFCETVETNYKNRGIRRMNLQNPIGFGKVLDEMV